MFLISPEQLWFIQTRNEIAHFQEETVYLVIMKLIDSIDYVVLNDNIWQHFYIEPPQHLTFITEIYCWIENDNYIHVADLASRFDSYIVELSFTNKLIFIIWSLYYRVVPFWIKTKRIWIETWLLCILKQGLFLNDTLW